MSAVMTANRSRFLLYLFHGEFFRGVSIVLIRVKLDERCLDADTGDLRVVTLFHIYPAR